jgi:hypothetical protein
VDGLPHFVGDGAEVAGVTNLKVAEAPFALRVGEGVDVAGRLLEIMQLYVAGHADDHFVKGAAGAVIVADVKVRPMGEPAGNKVLAMRSLMMATCCEVAYRAGRRRATPGGKSAWR